MTTLRHNPLKQHENKMLFKLKLWQHQHTSSFAVAQQRAWVRKCISKLASPIDRNTAQVEKDARIFLETGQLPKR